jgi:hypothetical protein
MQVLTQNTPPMERLSALIHKLQEQFEQNVPATQMLGTVRQIESELSQLAKPTNGYGTTKVAVMMPSGSRPETVHREPAREEKQYQPQPVREEKKYYQPQPVVEVMEKPVEVAVERRPYNGHPHTRKQEEAKAAPVAATQTAWAFDPLEEIPTLSHQQSVREINDAIGINGTSMNDRLREEKIELAHILTETPIRDLKKAIGVNDRYVFLNELFRGDETMYERSLKTLNSFRIYQEAEYWINRELKIKLGWSDDNSIVRHFCQLVRRRFS